MMDEWIQLVGKKVFIITNSKRYYTGVIVGVNNKNRNIILKDKYDLIIILSIDEIVECKEEK